MAIVSSLILLVGSLFLAWRGLDGVPRGKMLQMALIWAVIIVSSAIVLKALGL